MAYHLQRLVAFVNLIVVMLVKWVLMPHLDHDHHDRDHDWMTVCMDFDDPQKQDADHFDDQTIDFLFEIMQKMSSVTIQLRPTMIDIN